jgi:hypothetical protein
MITDRDITKLKEVFVTKEDFADLCIEVGELKEVVQDGLDTLNVKMDRFLGNIETVQLDNSAGAAILYRHDRQIQILADKTGVTLPLG